MNIAFFLKPKSEVVYLYSDMTVRQAYERMTRGGYTAIPMINREGKYICTLAEGDFLRFIVNSLGQRTANESLIRTMENTPVGNVLPRTKYVPALFDETIEQLFSLAQNQNFVPVVDGRGAFSGIVTRSEIIKYFIERENKSAAV